MDALEARLITVLLVDDHAVVREGYRRLLEQHADIAVVGEAADTEGALELFRRLAPQVVIMDITLPGPSGIEAMQRMLAGGAGARVLIFSMHQEAIFARRALQAGAHGYVTKASAPAVLVDAVRAVGSGRRYLSAAVAEELALRANMLDRNARDALSLRELEVLRLLVQGQTVRQVAASMGLTPKTVANYQSAIKQKLGAESALQLLRAAERLGLVEPAADAGQAAG